MSKKRETILFILIAFILTSSLVLAVDNTASSSGWETQVPKVIDDFVKVLQPVIVTLLGNTPSGDWMFAKLLFFLILFGVVYMVLEKIPLFQENTWVAILLSFAIPLLAVRWIGDGSMFETILLPYSVLGVAVTAGLPFVIWFLVIEVGLKGSQNKSVRRVAWGFFAIVFLGLYMARSKDLGNFGWIYPATALLALVIVLFDGSIQRGLLATEVERATMSSKKNQIRELKKRLAEMNEDYAKGLMEFGEYKTESNKLMKRIKDLGTM